MPRVLLDFTGPDGLRVHAALEDPVRVVTAASPADVLPALSAVQDGVAAGLTAAGFLSYEAAPAFEPRMRVHPGARMPLLWFALFDGETPLPPTRDGEAAHLDWRIEMDRAAHAAAIEAVRGHIADGRTYQVNLTTRLRAPFAGDPVDLWDRMRRAQGPGYHALLDLGRFVIASASPELFFRTRGREITTRPMKGTRPRGRWTAEDLALRDELADSGKDRAENLMIVDLLRNDLGRIARTGSVRVPRLLEVERYRTVWQMTSTIDATLRDDVALAHILAALFPCGSVTGAPKISTMQVIAALEPTPREVYCGAIGVIRPGAAGGDATFSVPIRTAWIDRDAGVAVYGAGGGVVWDSTPAAEYDELLAKAVVVREPWPAFRLVETLRLEDGSLVRRDRHLARLRDSAAYFGFPCPDDAAAAALDGIRRALPAGAHRVRLLLDEGGRVRAGVEPLEEPWGPDWPPITGPGVTGPGVSEPPSRARTVDLGRVPVSSADRFLFHKTTRRETYEQARTDAPADAWDVVLRNERGELTELTRGNLVLELDGRLLTPALAAGLLPGCLRAGLLEAGAIAEATLRPADLRRATRAWLVNSLRGWVEIRPRPSE
ncbi:MAG TPA: aminodeoxychorismate synthase component I [Longimicrobiales bacterium]|nr:aminodeoxychorismate synthase component I [Longimicrobiales bacterium]